MKRLLFTLFSFLTGCATIMHGEISRDRSRVAERIFYEDRLKTQWGKALGSLDGVAALVAEETARLPETISVEVVQDVTSIIRDRLVMLVGEPGIGKTTLVEVFLGGMVAEGELWTAWVLMSMVWDWWSGCRWC